MFQMRRRWAVFHLLATSRFVWLVIAVGIIALFALTPRTWSALTTLRVAVTAPSEDMQLMEAFRDALRQSEHGLRLKLMATQDEAGAAADLDNNLADLAIVRSDGRVPGTGETVLVAHHDAVLGIAVAKRKITTWADLAQKRIAIFPATSQNTALVDDMLAKFGVAPVDVEHIGLALEDVGTAINAKRLDAVIAIAPVTSDVTMRLIEQVRAGSKLPPVLLDVEQAEGLAKHYPKFEKIDIPTGFYSAAPSLPADDITVLGVSYLLQARVTLDETIVTNLTKLLFSLRPQVAARQPLAVHLEKPTDDKTSLRAVHLGAAAYYADTEKTFMDRFGDWFYIGAMLFSGVISALAGLFGLSHARARRKALFLIDQLISAKVDAHHATQLADLTDVATRIEHLSTLGLQHARDNHFDETGISALRLAIDEARKAVDDQRNELVTLRVRAPMALLETTEVEVSPAKA